MNVILSTYGTPGLSGNFLRAKQIGFGLIQNSCRVTVVTSAAQIRFLPKYTFEDGLQIIESPGLFPFRVRQSGLDPYDFFWRFVLLFALRPEIIHGFNPKINSSIPSLIVAKIKNIPFFYDWADLWGPGGLREFKKKHFLSNLSSHIESLLEKWLPHKASVVSCVSSEMVRYCKKRNISSVFTPVGVPSDITVLKKSMVEVPESHLNSVAKNNASTIVGFVFTHSPDERFLCKIIRETYKIDKRIYFLLMGPRISELKTATNVVFNDFVDRSVIENYLALCDFCILPFQDKKINQYRYPNKVGDYLAAEKPFISNRTGDMVMLIEKYQVGWFGDERPEKFAQKISEISKNKKSIAKLQSNIRSCNPEISWQKITFELKNSYANFANQSSSS